jgi:hypothetical protein
MPYLTSVERFGIQQGLQEGIAAALAARFGTAGKRLMSRVRALHDVAELRALSKAIPTAASLQELRDRLPPRSAGAAGAS